MKRSIFWGSILGAIILDQGSKWLVSSLGWTVVLNTGISFGIQIGLEIGLSLLLLIGLGWVALSRISSQTYVFWGMFLGAASSNLVDRFLFGGVRDWLSWPIFGFRNNLADVFIFVGLLGILFFEFVWDNQKSKKDV